MKRDGDMQKCCTKEKRAYVYAYIYTYISYGDKEEINSC